MKDARNVESELGDVNERKVLRVSGLVAWKHNRVKRFSLL